MNTYEMIFSPTGGTKKAADQLATTFGGETKTVDLTNTTVDFSQIPLTPNDICIVAVPSFGGRVPAAAASRLEEIEGNGAKAILLTVYGNRAYEDTLLELKSILTNAGFHCIAAVAAIGEHSIMHQYASGRPDQKDLKELAVFAEKIRKCIESSTLSDDLKVPGNMPYREYHGVPIKPKVKKGCTQCGLCAKECPVEAIPKENPLKTDEKKCISCMRCISICPEHARKVNGLLVEAAAKKMKKSCSEQKKNELFI